MACNFASAFARIWKAGSGLGIRNRRHVTLWIFKCMFLLMECMGVKSGLQVHYPTKPPNTREAHLQIWSLLALKQVPGRAEWSKLYLLSSNRCLVFLDFCACAQNCIKCLGCRVASVWVTFSSLYPRLMTCKRKTTEIPMSEHPMDRSSPFFVAMVFVCKRCPSNQFWSELGQPDQEWLKSCQK